MISMGKKYRTRDGRDVRLLCVDAGGSYPVAGCIEDEDGVVTWTESGRFSAITDMEHLDLIEHREPDIRTIWVNVYRDRTSPYGSEETAKNAAVRNAISIAQPVTFEVKRS